MTDRHVVKAYPLRIPDELKGWVKQRASKNMRSMNAELNILLVAVKGQIERKEGQKTTS